MLTAALFMFIYNSLINVFNQVARDAVLNFRPGMTITPHHANVKDPEFNVEFFKQFNVVLNGLDNLDARRHVNRLCLAADVPLVESGTTGFLGQVITMIFNLLETVYLSLKGFFERLCLIIPFCFVLPLL